MSQTTLFEYSERANQCYKILKLLKLKGFAYTKELIGLGIYQYNSRIHELRHGKYDRFRYIIEACVIDEIRAFKYHGFHVDDEL